MAGHAPQDKLEKTDSHIKQLIELITGIPDNIRKGNILDVLVPIVVILFSIYYINNTEMIFGIRVVDIVGIILFFFVVLVTGKYINTKIIGLNRYLPACHDFVKGIAYCARHNGFHLGLIFWLFIGIFIFRDYLIGFSCWVIATNSILSWVILFLLIVTPMHGWLTKIGLRIPDSHRLWAAFLWGLLVLLNAFIFYKWIVPC